MKFRNQAYAWASAAGAQGRGAPPLDFYAHDTNIVDRGLKMLFFGVF